MGSFTYDGNNFLLNGKPFTVISGAVHYFRTMPDQWEDRLCKLKACGFNTVETYTCWNLHERREGIFDFSGLLDLERFIETAASLGLYVILRPGPYICAEWEFGGLPSWLLSYPDIAVRCDDPLYLSKVTPYYEQLLSRIRPHLITKGGNVLMVQVENEYGSYGDDKSYLAKIEALYRKNGIDCMLFTSDGTALWMLGGGTLPHVLAVANFGSKTEKSMNTLKKFQPDRPLMCGEFWGGWFEHWYEERRAQRTEEVVQELNTFFDLGASFNMYMFHGGTNFGFWNGANCWTKTGEYVATVTSYDYTAPLSEAGDLTPQWFAIRELIEKRTGKKAPTLAVKNSQKTAYGTVKLTRRADLFENLTTISTPVRHAYPRTMEQVGQDFGYILYSTVLHGPFEPLRLNFGAVHDRAIVFWNGKRMGMIERSRQEDEIELSLEAGQSGRLEILVENMGRVNYGPYMFDRKGILDGVRLGQRFHFGWEMYPMTMDDLKGLVFHTVEGDMKEDLLVPAFFAGTLRISGTPTDTFLRTDGFAKGFCVINGFNVGRYYNTAGPQKTLYIPAPLLKEGDNEIILFETDACASAEVVFADTPDLG